MMMKSDLMNYPVMRLVEVDKETVVVGMLLSTLLLLLLLLDQQQQLSIHHDMF